MTKKEQAQTILKSVYEKSKNTTDSGVYGKLYEISLKYDLGLYDNIIRNNGITKRGKTDCIKNHTTLEIKSGGGELATIDAGGVIADGLKCKKVIYLIDATLYENFNSVEEIVDYYKNNAVVFDKSDFIEMLQDNKLIALKYSAYMSKQDKNFKYHDRVSIGLNRSKGTSFTRLNNAIQKALESGNATTYKKYKESIGV